MRIEDYNCSICNSVTNLSQKPNQSNELSEDFVNWVNCMNESCPNFTGEQFKKNNSIMKRKK